MSRNYKSIIATIGLLAETYPKRFSVLEQRRKPLKVGIHRDLTVDPKALKAALQFYCLNHRYLLACYKGAVRIDLNGEPCGTVTVEEATCARERLKKLQEKHKRRREAKEREERKARNKGRLTLAGLRKAAQARRAA